ncbi:helix-turn-helix transcriptional regulator [Actinomycetospora sp. NBRC 106375]|uniref:LuxR C-terminal-related transcriptional regulator n=1 Tax=Actinomycetospora sp. NBRC 106375 TaxID=3032207 RepID=UPI0024A32B99|nr:LuxR C-terminal-related transcriptional regulator [Actinomycetospora sp. NBRC 106375]GLZ47560.1 helix-turn-helix transcriptional regulator [Actinomycetospora sp. NBRC 106375]
MAQVGRSRIGPPVIPAEYVRRRDLEAALARGADRDLVLVSAPPGFGKTSLLASWVGDDHGRGTAWVRLEPEDRDPRRLWNAVLAALAALPAVPPSSRLHRLVVSRSTVAPEFLGELAEALACLPSPVRLVLDDVQHVTDPLSRRGLEMLVRDARPGLRLVLAGRRDPALPLPRLRLEERVTELRAAQLQFSPDETAALVDACGLALDPAQLAALHERTGGWVAGLRLAALSLRDHPDPDRFLASFSGDERPVADYLVDEVLGGLAAPHVEVLRRTSVAGRVPAGLAAALAGREDAAQLLDELARDTGLVAGTGARGDPYHLPELLRSYLAADLGRRGPAVAAGLQATAAGWWSEHGDPVRALQHAAASGDPAVLAGLIGRWGPWLAGRGEHGPLAAALAAAEPEGRRDLRLATAYVHVQLARGDAAGVRDTLRRARRARPVRDSETADTADPANTANTADTVAFRTATERMLGRRVPVTGTERVPADPALAAAVRVGRGAAALLADDPGRARAELGAGLALAHRQGLDVLAHRGRGLLAVALWAAGDVPRAGETAERVLAAADADGPAAAPWTAPARAVDAHASLLRGDPARARTTAGGALGDDDGGTAAASATSGAAPLAAVRFALRAARGGAAFDLGDRASGLLELQAARAELGDVPVPTALAEVAALLEHRAAVALGHPTAAVAVAAWLAGRVPLGPAAALMRAGAAAAAGDHVAARQAVAPLLARRSRPTPDALEVEAWLVESRGRLAREDRPGARTAARRAVDLAEPLDALRPFAHADGAVRALLVDELAAGAARAGFVARALAAGAASTAGIALSGREHDVLARLPSLESLDEIAGDLDVSINTIKTHVRALYGKLGVTTRRDAVLVAHEQGLLG